MPMYTKLMALHTCVAEVVAVAVQMGEAEAHRSELEEKVLKIEEKEDNKIAYLET